MKAVLPFVILLGVAACGREPDAAPSTTRKATTVSAASGTEDSVAAVAQSPGKTTVSLRFAIDGKPRIGAASRLRLDLAGDPGPFLVRIQGEGMALEPAAMTVNIAEDAKPVSQSVSVTPQVAGISELMVRVQPPGDGAQEVVYAIPLLVEGAPAK